MLLDFSVTLGLYSLSEGRENIHSAPKVDMREYKTGTGACVEAPGALLLRDVWGYWFLTSHSGVMLDPDIKELRKPWADPLIAIRYNDVRDKVDSSPGVLEKYRAAWEAKGMVQEDGLLVEWYSPKQDRKMPGTDVSNSAWAIAFMNSWNPAFARKTSDNLSAGFLARPWSSDQLGPAWESGGLLYPSRDGDQFDFEGPGVDVLTGNAAIAYARLNVPDGQRKMYERPWREEHFATAPFVEGMDLSSGVDFVRGGWDGEVGALVVTVISWDGTKKR